MLVNEIFYFSLTINISYTWENISGKEKMYKPYTTFHFYSIMILTSSVDISLKGKQCQKVGRRELLWQNQYTYRPKRLRTMCLFYIQSNRALRVFAINWWKVQEWLPAVIVVSHIATIFREIKHWLAGDSTVLCYQRSSFRFPNFKTGGFWSLLIPIKKLWGGVLYLFATLSNRINFLPIILSISVLPGIIWK